jgi:hypothetical protein
MSKHTPGPWTAKHTSGAGLSVHADVSKALGPRYSHDCLVYHLGNDACTMTIAYELWTQFPRAEWDAMQEANARLIAAAPDLLEALMLARACLAGSTDKTLLPRSCKAIDVAISKATGEIV